MKLEKLTTEQLLAELKNRKVKESLSIEQKIEKLTPKPIDNPNLEELTKLCINYVNESIEGYVNENMDNWMMETALETIMGKDVFKKISEIKNIRKEK